VHARVPKVLNAPEVLGAGPAQSAAARAQNVAGADQTVVAQVQNVGEVDLIAVEDHDAVAVHCAGAFPHVARAPVAKVVAHNCVQVDPDVAWEFRFSQGVQVAQIARGDQFPPAAGSFPGVPAVHFVQAALFSRAAHDVPQGFRFPLPAVWWEQLTVVALAAPNRWWQEYLCSPDVPVADSYARAAQVGRQCCRLLRVRQVLDQVDPRERVPDELVALLRL
jgi:hypothetical protein